MSDEIAAAFIALVGVAGAGVIQWLVTGHTVRAESERLRQQLFAEFHRAQFTEWQSKFRETVAHLLAATDPELNSRFEKAKVVPLVLRAQLMLNPKLPAHARELSNHSACYGSQRLGAMWCIRAFEAP